MLTLQAILGHRTWRWFAATHKLRMLISRKHFAGSARATTGGYDSAEAIGKCSPEHDKKAQNLRRCSWALLYLLIGCANDYLWRHTVIRVDHDGVADRRYDLSLVVHHHRLFSDHDDYDHHDDIDDDAPPFLRSTLIVVLLALVCYEIIFASSIS